jgi:hypothetical protein
LVFQLKKKTCLLELSVSIQTIKTLEAIICLHRHFHQNNARKIIEICLETQRLHLEACILHANENLYVLVLNDLDAE